MMAGPPLRLNIDPEATPVIAHKAASVPVHWEGKVKEHLDRAPGPRRPPQSHGESPHRNP